MAGMAPLPAIRWPITPNGGFDRLATPGSDPKASDDACKYYGSLLILKLPLAEHWPGGSSAKAV